LEAMACGLAIVIRDKHSLRDRVEGGAGLLTSGHPADIRNKLSSLLNDPELLERTRRRAREKVEAELCWEHLARQFESPWARTHASSVSPAQ
jgi:glycosyltransferase involved in cell wall biosynthesis